MAVEPLDDLSLVVLARGRKLSLVGLSEEVMSKQGRAQLVITLRCARPNEPEQAPDVRDRDRGNVVPEEGGIHPRCEDLHGAHSSASMCSSPEVFRSHPRTDLNARLSERGGS